MSFGSLSSDEARAYLAKHGVLDRLQVEVLQVLKDRPDDPVHAIGKALQGLAGTLVPVTPRSPLRSGSNPPTPTRPEPAVRDAFGSSLADLTPVASTPINDYLRSVVEGEADTELEEDDVEDEEVEVDAEAVEEHGIAEI